ncbi:MAG TPA: glycosyltransferase [Tepidisphaeraceae bacterium]|jgi:glycosyltransferase involved in cell wall biosynthesis
MHYVFLSTGSWEGNASMVRPRELGRELIARGIDVTYAVDDVEYNRKSLNLDPKARIVFTSKLGGFSQIAARRRTLKDLKPDFVHVLNPAPKTAAALWGSRWRVVGDWDEWPAMRPSRPVKHAMERYLDRWLRNRSVRVVVASRYLQEQFRGRFGLDAAYIPYAAYLPDHPSTTSPFTQRTAVYMGNLYPAYDHDLLFDAAVQLKARGRMPPIIFLGHGPDLEKWRGFVKEQGLWNVDVPGYTTGEELWRRLRHAHVLLFPIRPTILNLARCPSKTFAYAQARRPVITNRVGESPEVLGEKATYVNATADAFANAIEDAMSRELADVDYGVEAHNWGARADALLGVLPK